MALAFRLTAKAKPKFFIAIDIGSPTAIRSIFFDATDRDRVALDKHYLELPSRQRETDLIPLIDEHVRRLIFHYLRRQQRIPEGVLIGIGGHLVENEVGVVEHARQHPSSPLRSEELTRILQDYARARPVKSVANASYVLASLVPFRLSVDGYRIERPTRATVGRTVAISVFATYAQSAYARALGRMSARWGGMDVRFVSDQAAVAAAVISLLKVSEALVVKIGAKTTEVTLIGDSAVRSIGRFERGGDAFSAAIAKRLGIEQAEAERIKRQFGTTLLPKRLVAAVQAAASEAAEAWLADLVGLLAAEERSLLPERIYLLGGGARLSAVPEMLAAKPWFQELTFLDRITVEVLGAERFSSLGFRNATPPLSGPENVCLISIVGRLTGQVATPEFLPADVVSRIE